MPLISNRETFESEFRNRALKIKFVALKNDIFFIENTYLNRYVLQLQL